MPTNEEPLSLDEYRSRNAKTKPAAVFQHTYPIGDLELLTIEQLLYLCNDNDLETPDPPGLDLVEYVPVLVDAIKSEGLEVPDLTDVALIYQEGELAKVLTDAEAPVPVRGGDLGPAEYRTKLIDLLFSVGREMEFKIKRDSAFELLGILSSNGLPELTDKAIQDIIFRRGASLFQEIALAIIVEPPIVPVGTDPVPTGMLAADELDPMDVIQLMNNLVKEFKQGGRPQAATFRGLRDRVASRPAV